MAIQHDVREGEGQRLIRTPNVNSTSFKQTLKWCPLPVALLFLALIIPTEISFDLGGLRLTPYRVVLIVMFFPSLFRLRGNSLRGGGWVDIMIAFNVFWSFGALAVIHGFDVALESGGVRALELSGAYLVARAYICDIKSFKGSFAFITSIVVVLAPITFYESLTGQHIIKEIAVLITGGSFSSAIDTRFGFSRAFGPFDHPILYGVFAASVFGIATYNVAEGSRKKGAHRIRQALIVLAAVSSVSSGAMAALSTQFLLCFWDKFTKKIASRWKLLLFIFVSFFIIVDLFSNRSAMTVFLSYFSFSTATAYNRIIIFEYGIQDVWRNPIWGIGFNVWTRPSWMHSTSMDNFWLFQAVTFGIPSFLSLALATLILLFKNWKSTLGYVRQLRTGWTISLISLIIAASTVHFWNSLFVYFAFILGSGCWFVRIAKRPAKSM